MYSGKQRFVWNCFPDFLFSPKGAGDRGMMFVPEAYR